MNFPLYSHKLCIDPVRDDVQLIRTAPSNQLLCSLCRTMFSRVLITGPCFHHLQLYCLQPPDVSGTVGEYRKRGAHVEFYQKNGLRTLVSSLIYENILLIMVDADVAARSGCARGPRRRASRWFRIFTQPSSLLFLL